MKNLFLWSLLLSVLAINPLTSAAETETDIPKVLKGMPLVYHTDFAEDASEWEPTDPKAWKVAKDGDRTIYSLHQKSNYQPPVRSPHGMSLLKDLKFSDFILEAVVKSTAREYGHRDICFFFGWNDPAHFYYVHVATKADPHAHSIFLVNDEPRVSIAKKRTDGVRWEDDTYFKVRIIRNAKSGTIKVYFDDMNKAIMQTTDKHFTEGRIGIGSFDDTGDFDSIKIWGKVVK